MHIEHFHLSQNGLPNVPVSTINLIKLHEFSHLFPNFLRWFGIYDNFFIILESCYRLSVKYKQRFVFQISLIFSSLWSAGFMLFAALWFMPPCLPFWTGSQPAGHPEKFGVWFSSSKEEQKQPYITYPIDYWVLDILCKRFCINLKIWRLN